jgi:hypothetical protein
MEIKNILKNKFLFEKKPFTFKKVKTNNLNLQQEAKKEIGETLQKIRENEKQWKEQLDIETDGGFYFQVVFKNAKEMQDFLKEKNIKLQGNDFIFIDDVIDKFK